MESNDSLLSYRKSRLNLSSAINSYDFKEEVYHFKFNQASKFYNWLVNQCIKLDIDIKYLNI